MSSLFPLSLQLNYEAKKNSNIDKEMIKKKYIQKINEDFQQISLNTSQVFGTRV